SQYTGPGPDPLALSQAISQLSSVDEDAVMFDADQDPNGENRLKRQVLTVEDMELVAEGLRRVAGEDVGEEF
ncbi:hypothetical protein HK104_011462, partial [Borealophlyctis nickersoniae]